MFASGILKIITCLAIGIFLFIVFQKLTNELGTKREWANLQSIDSNPNVKIKRDKKIQIAEFNGSEILILKNPNNKDYLLILLNCKHRPYYKEFGPHFLYEITQDEMNNIQKNSKNITPTVASVLASHVKR